MRVAAAERPAAALTTPVGPCPDGRSLTRAGHEWDAAVGRVSGERVAVPTAA